MSNAGFVSRPCSGGKDGRRTHPPKRRIAMSIHVLAGSVREPLAGARLAGKANPAERLQATVLLPRQNADAFKAKVAKLAAGRTPEAFLGRADFARQFGASLVD